jgi:metal transporter CNNM
LILLFGEILPQSICSRYGLAIGASVAPLVRVLVWICFPIAYPIAKVLIILLDLVQLSLQEELPCINLFSFLFQLLDHVLGHGKAALFRRAELKTLVTLHGNEAGKGGELTHDETTIIAGALELSEKKAKDAMTPLCETFVIDINAKLDRKLMQEVIEKGHSRVPVYYERETNIIGLILVKNLLSINPDDEIPIKSVTIRKIPRVSEDLPLYDILNEFQKGHSHMAVVIRHNFPNYPAKQLNNDGETLEVAIAIDDKLGEKAVKNLTPLRRWKSYPNTQNSNTGSRRGKWSKDQSDVLQVHEEPLPTLSEDEEAVGIITMEDVIEELLQEEIYDETDVHVEEQ